MSRSPSAFKEHSHRHCIHTEDAGSMNIRDFVMKDKLTHPEELLWSAFGHVFLHADFSAFS